MLIFYCTGGKLIRQVVFIVWGYHLRPLFIQHSELTISRHFKKCAAHVIYWPYRLIFIWGDGDLSLPICYAYRLAFLYLDDVRLLFHLDLVLQASFKLLVLIVTRLWCRHRDYGHRIGLTMACRR